MTGRGYIHHMAVSESEQRQGIGTSLLNVAMSALMQEGIAKVALVVFSMNNKAIPFGKDKALLQEMT